MPCEPQLARAAGPRISSPSRYSNASDYVRDLIRRDQERAAQIARLQTAITEGIESGVAGDFSMPAIQSDLDRG